jgi:hypothetical protein
VRSISGALSLAPPTKAIPTKNHYRR